jgi:hypothetical protein
MLAVEGHEVEPGSPGELDERRGGKGEIASISDLTGSHLGDDVVGTHV